MRSDFKKNTTLPAGLLIAFLILWGCTAGSPRTPSPGTTEQAIFRHRWWNYYARGVAAAEQRNYADAVGDFLAAMQKRTNDQYMARSYGMHFVDYFPHRELGIVLWEMNKLDQAQAQLETSIAQTPTAKAHYFLDRVREARIHRMMQQNGPVRPPTIRIDDAAEGIRTRQDPVMISGSIVDPNYVASLTIGGSAWFLAGSRQRVEFRQPLALPDGLHQVTVRARGLSGLSAQQRLAIYVDRQGPVVDVQIVEKVRNGMGSGWVLRGRCIDPSGVASLAINDNHIALASQPIEPFDITVDPKTQVVDFAAKDPLGNVTHGQLNLNEMSAMGRSRPTILLASRESTATLGRLFAAADVHPPTIRLNGWTASQTVYMDSVVIEGSAWDDRRIASVTINQRPISEAPLTGVFTGFSSAIALMEGENTISISATDASGNQTVEKIVVLRREPKAQLLRHRLSVSILPFAQRGRITVISDAFQDVFAQQLALQNRFNLVERRLLDVILQEHKISRTDLAAPETALEMGRLTAADAFLSGSIIETRLGVEAIARFVDTETAEVLTMVDAFIEKKSFADLKQTAQRLAIKLHREFPVVEGEVLDRQKQAVITNLGSEQLRAQRRVLIVQKKPVRHPITKKPLGSDYQVLGHARLVQIQKDFSTGELYKGSDPGIGPSYGVVTQ